MNSSTGRFQALQPADAQEQPDRQILVAAGIVGFLLESESLPYTTTGLPATYPLKSAGSENMAYSVNVPPNELPISTLREGSTR